MKGPCEFSRLKKSATYLKYFWCENSNILIGFKIQTFQNYIIKSYVSPDFFGDIFQIRGEIDKSSIKTKSLSLAF